jgi:site-specific DNA recombinase
VLFIKWDRFSRNAGDAYYMINTLRRLGVEPQAIEQPLDLSIPENKLMLAFYLAAPEVENDRRALNVINGMRKAKKEGRYMGLAPIGYLNKTDESGRKYIAPNPSQAPIIRWAYEQIAAGTYNTEQIYKSSKKKGFKGTKALFWFAIRNPVYCGKIFIAKYKNEPADFVKGQHQPIISEDLYYKVQDVLDGRKRSMYRPKIVTNPELPLRGYLICPQCSKLLTGSKSKGRNKYFTYYHCREGCSCRFRADQVHEKFITELRKFTPRPAMLDLYKVVLKESWQNLSGESIKNEKNVASEINEIETRISYLKELLISKQIEPADFREMKSDCELKLNKLLASQKACNDEKIDFDGLLDIGLNNLLQLSHIYEKGDVEKKRKVVGSIYPENFIFDGSAVRTKKINEVISLIFNLDKGSSENKNGQNGNESTLSSQVGMTRFELATPRPPDVCATGLRYIPKYCHTLLLFTIHLFLRSTFNQGRQK